MAITPNGLADAICDEKFTLPFERLASWIFFSMVLSGAPIIVKNVDHIICW